MVQDGAILVPIMNSSTTTSTTVKLNVSAGMLQNAQSEASRIGISVQDFIRMLLATYFAHGPSIHALTPDDQKYQQALHDIQAGRYTVIKDRKQLAKHLSDLN